MGLGEYPKDLPFSNALEAMSEASTKAELAEMLAPALEHLGVDQYALHLSPAPCPSLASSRIRVVSSYDPCWLNYYNRMDFMLVDPVAERALRRCSYFYWEDLDIKTDGASDVMNQARRFDICNGLSISHITHLGFVCLSICFSKSPAQLLTSNQIATLYLTVPFFQREVLRVLMATGELESELTAKECEVLVQLARGQTNKQIAEELDVEVSTINTHVRSICAKLDVTNRTEAVTKAWKTGEFVLMDN